MATEYATLAALKAARRKGDTGDDAALQSALAAASRAIDRKTGRRFYLDPAASARVFRPHGRTVATCDGERLLVDDIGASDGLVVEVGSGSSWTPLTSGEYETAPDSAISKGEAITSLLRLSAYWGYGAMDRVRVTAKWGWPAIPDEIAQATLLLANRLYMRKDNPEGITGSAEWGVIRLSRWDPDVETLVGPYVLPGIG